MSDTIDTVLERLIGDAVRAGRFRSAAHVLQEVGLSRGYLAELRGRAARDPSTTITLDTAEKFAAVLGCPVSILSRDAAASLDKYPGREWAIIAARALQLPEQAIQAVLSEDPGIDPGRLWWFRRIESESSRAIPPAASR